MAMNLLPISFAVAILAIVPSIYSLQAFYRTRLNDYLILMGVWIIGASIQLIRSGFFNISPLLRWQMEELLIILLSLSLMSYGLRVLFSERQYYTFLSLTLAYSFLLIVILIQWKQIEQGSFLIDLPPDPNSPDPSFGYSFQNTIIYAANHKWLRLLFTFVSFLLFAIVHINPPIVLKNQNTRKALMLWRIAAICGVISQTFSWNWLLFPAIPDLSALFGLITTFSLILIVVFYPEGYLLTKVQIYRVLETYKLIKEKKRKLLKISLFNT